MSVKELNKIDEVICPCEKQEEIIASEIGENLKCPKDMQQIAELVRSWHDFASDFLSHQPEEILNFYLKTDGLRRQMRFELILESFKNLNIDTSKIDQLKTQLNLIKISDLKNINIAQELAEERLLVITRFIDSA